MRLTLGPGDDLAALVREAEGESIVVVIPPLDDALALARAKASIAPLAIERAPATRVNAVAAGKGAAPEAIDSLVGFLEAAGSTTGQLLEVGFRDAEG